MTKTHLSSLSIGNGHLHLNAWLNTDRCLHYELRSVAKSTLIYISTGQTLLYNISTPSVCKTNTQEECFLIRITRGYNLLDSLGSTMQVNDSLVDSHLVPVPRLGSLTTGGLPGSDPQHFGWHTNWTFHSKLGFLSSADEITTYCVCVHMCVYSPSNSLI